MSFYVFHFAAVILLATTMACSASSASSLTAPAPAPTPSKAAKTAKTSDIPAGSQIAVFAGGCFWGVEAVFEHVKGVSESKSGYAGGQAKTADYDTVSEGRSGHAESVQVTFDPSVVSYEQLLKIFFSVVHDPTELNRQGPDTGTQYRSAIFFTSEEQKAAAEKYIGDLTNAKIYAEKIVTEVTPLEKFYDAEKYHQNYLALHPNDPYIVVNDQPKVKALESKFPDLYKTK
jgi:peptide-methionine (S)-S-oxide reductase